MRDLPASHLAYAAERRAELFVLLAAIDRSWLGGPGAILRRDMGRALANVRALVAQAARCLP